MFGEKGPLRITTINSEGVVGLGGGRGWSRKEGGSVFLTTLHIRGRSMITIPLSPIKKD